jgi:quinoprotein glucose dehydrogenase
MRVRQEAQFALASRGQDALKVLSGVARKHNNHFVRIHALWAMGQIIRGARGADHNESITSAQTLITRLLSDADSEVRAQSARILGESHFASAVDPLITLLKDPSPRVRSFAAMNLGKLHDNKAVGALLDFLRDNGDQDPVLRHAGVMALTWLNPLEALKTAATNESPAVRMGALLAMRRLQRDDIALFLNDREPRIVLEAARAIYDEPINGAVPDLARLIDSVTGPGPLVRRVLNANFRLGTVPAAQALATFAARTDAADKMRSEALEQLADWVHPSGRDRVVGLWRPVAATRQRDTAADALRPVLPEILKHAPESVSVSALITARRLMITNIAPALVDLVKDTKAPGPVRVEALKTLAATEPPQLEQVLTLAESDPNEELRKAATDQQLTRSANPTATLAARLESGTLREKQAALTSLGALRDAAADQLLLQWLDKLLKGDLPKELQLDLLEAAAKRADGRVKHQLEKYNEAKPKDDLLAEFRETLYGGKAAEGKAIFFERPEAQCVRCHKINNQGGDVGPDLSHVGAQKDRNYLLESVLLPNKQIAQGFESVLVTTKNGDVYGGVLKGETATDLLINSPDTGVVTVKKADVESRRKALSPMPEGIGQLLSKQDLRNLVEFLSTQQ